MTRHHPSTRSIGTAALLAFAVALAACGGDDDSGGGAPAAATVTPPSAVKSAGKITFCSDIAYPPMESYEGTKAVGLDVDLGDDLAGRMGVEAEFKNTGFDGIIAALEARQCDAILSSMTVTPERSKQVTFVKYAKVGPAVLVAKGNPKGIHTVDDLGGTSVAVQVGTTDKDFLEQASSSIERKGGDPIKIQSFPRDTDAASALRADRVDAWVSDSPPIADYARKNPELFEQVGGQLDAAPIGIAVRKDDVKLSEALHAAVTAAYSDGSMERLLAHWRLPNIALK